MESWELIARENVRDTLARYTHAGDSFRLEELAGCFTEDGSLEIVDRRGGRGREKDRGSARGRAALVELLSAAPPDGPPSPGFFVRHFVANVRFDSVAPELIGTSSYFVVFTDAGPDHWGRYQDRLVPVGERWLFESRRVTVDGATPGGFFAGPGA